VDLQRLVNAWSEELAPKTVHRTYGTLRAALGFAVAAELIQRSPCRSVKLPKLTQSERRPLSAEDVAALADAVDERYRAMVWVAALLGLRWGEAAGLRVGRLDLLAATVTVAEIVTRDRYGRPVTGPPKSVAGVRRLSLPGVLVEILAEHLAALELTAVDADAWVFPAPEGGAWSYANYRRRIWLPAVARAGLEGVGFHDLRRVAATALVLENVDLKTAGTRLGHSDPRLTLAVYAQATSEADRAAAEAVGERFATVLSMRPRDGRAMGAETDAGSNSGDPV